MPTLTLAALQLRNDAKRISPARIKAYHIGQKGWICPAGLNASGENFGTIPSTWNVSALLTCVHWVRILHKPKENGERYEIIDPPWSPKTVIIHREANGTTSSIVGMPNDFFQDCLATHLTLMDTEATVALQD